MRLVLPPDPTPYHSGTGTTYSLDGSLIPGQYESISQGSNLVSALTLVSTLVNYNQVYYQEEVCHTVASPFNKDIQAKEEL
jgi:hypothetical protein